MTLTQRHEIQYDASTASGLDSPDALGAVNTDLGECRRLGKAFFDGIADDLGDIRQRTGGLSDLMSRVSGLCGKIGETASVHGEIDRLVGELGDVLAGIAKAISGNGLSDKVETISDHLRMMRREAQRLLYLNSLTMGYCATTSLATSLDKIGHQRILAERVISQGEKLKQTCAGMLDSSHSTAALLSRIARDLSDGLDGDASGAGMHETALSELQRDATAVAGRTIGRAPEAMELLIESIQFSDSSDQRLDHLSIMLGDPNLSADAVAIALAQVRGLGSDQRQTGAAIGRAVDLVGEIAADIEDNFADAERDRRTEAALRSQGAAIDTLTGFVTRLKGRVVSAHDSLDSLVHVVADAREEFKAQGEDSEDVKIAARNLSLLQSEDAIQRDVLRVLTADSHSVASEMEAMIERINRPLEDIMDRISPRVLAPVTEKLERLEELFAWLENSRQALTDLHRLIGEGRNMRAELVKRLSSLRDGMAGFDAITDLSDRMAAGLRRIERTGGTTAHRQSLMDLYTMRREREIHLELFPADGTLDEAPSSPSDNDDPLAAFEMF